MKRLLKKYKAIIMYLISGVGTTVVNWVVYALLMKIDGIGMTSANIGAWIAAVLFAFVTNKWLVFESKSLEKQTVLKELSMFVSSRVLTGVIEIVGLPLLVYVGLNQSLFGVEGFVAKVFISIVVIILNYVLSRILVFNKKI